MIAIIFLVGMGVLIFALIKTLILGLASGGKLLTNYLFKEETTSCFEFPKDNLPKEITIKDSYLNTEDIEQYKSNNTKKFIYRPKNLSEFIGQEKAKALTELNIKKIKQLKPVHFLISGLKGHGKTTLAHIISNQLNAKIIERVAGEITNPDQIIELINKINSYDKDEIVVLFIDEIHGLKPTLCENFYSIMEDFKLAGKNIKPFIMIGATTEKNILLDKVSPLVDRFQVQLELTSYNSENIIEILKQYKRQLFPDKIIPIKTIEVISKNSKFTPRIAISLLEDSLIESDIEKVLQYHRIISNGLTDVDFQILDILNENKRPIGESALSQMLGINKKDYSTLYEPYLAKQGYIIRTQRGRVMGEKGKEILKNARV